MDTPTPVTNLDVAVVSAGVHAILRHLCADPCHAYGAVVEWCETRGDCVQAVVCPTCRREFLVDDDELSELMRWTDGDGKLLACGIQID